MSVEEMCRRLLHQALSDDLVRIPDYDTYRANVSIKEYSANLSQGDLAGMINLLQQFINESFKHE